MRNWRLVTVSAVAALIVPAVPVAANAEPPTPVGPAASSFSTGPLCAGNPARLPRCRVVNPGHCDNPQSWGVWFWGIPNIGNDCVLLESLDLGLCVTVNVTDPGWIAVFSQQQGGAAGYSVKIYSARGCNGFITIIGGTQPNREYDGHVYSFSKA